MKKGNLFDISNDIISQFVFEHIYSNNYSAYPYDYYIFLLVKLSEKTSLSPSKSYELIILLFGPETV